jgi:hypothetical protein
MTAADGSCCQLQDTQGYCTQNSREYNDSSSNCFALLVLCPADVLVQGYSAGAAVTANLACTLLCLAVLLFLVCS